MANGWTRVGTSYFVSQALARKYYRDYTANTLFYVQRAIKSGEIHIGKPSLKPGQRLLVIDNGTRYAIETPDGIK